MAFAERLASRSGLGELTRFILGQSVGDAAWESGDADRT
jgi:hypothetical protein